MSLHILHLPPNLVFARAKNYQKSRSFFQRYILAILDIHELHAMFKFPELQLVSQG